MSIELNIIFILAFISVLLGTWLAIKIDGGFKRLNIGDWFFFVTMWLCVGIIGIFVLYVNKII